MSVKPGDLAIVCRTGSLNLGRIVEVLYVAPTDDFLLPDGTLSEGMESDLGFVCKGIGGPLRFRAGWGGMDIRIVTGWFAAFCACPKCLRPLPGDETPESEVRRDEVEA